MKKLITLECVPTNIEKSADKLAEAINKDFWVELSPTVGKRSDIPNHLLPKGSGILISSSGSCGGPHQCLHPFSHLDQSALATGKWLQEEGLEPNSCHIFNPLPFHHVSGLMPWWRSRAWGCNHTWLHPSLMRNPTELETFCKPLFQKKSGPLLTSLVPTHVQRLMEHPAGLDWLQSFDVIWVGGSNLAKNLAEFARKKKIRLAPCYGATETAAMVTVLPPNSFLSGNNGCGTPLTDVELRLNNSGALEIKTLRVALACWKNGRIEDVKDKNGWWKSGDSAKLTQQDCIYNLEIQGRLDTAIHSGGETIFPEALEIRLLKDAKSRRIPIKNLLFLSINENEWGQRLVGLVKWHGQLTKVEEEENFLELKKLVKVWLPAERPFTWYTCQELTKNTIDKWERLRWQNWLDQITNN